MQIVYALEPDLTANEFRDILVASTLGSVGQSMTWNGWNGCCVKPISS